MSVNFTDQEKIRPQESPIARKFQRLVKAINTHILRKGVSSRDPSPFEHHSQSVMWDDGAGSGKSVYAKLLSKERTLLRNDRAATIILSHLPDEEGDRRVFLTAYDFICDGLIDTEVIQKGVDLLLDVGGGKMFLKHGTYEITAPIQITIPKKMGTTYPHTLEIEGERGTALNCRVTPGAAPAEGVSPPPGLLKPAMFHIDLRGEDRKLNRVIFRNLTFFSNAGSTGKFVNIIPHESFPQEVIFEKCTFVFGETAYAIESMSMESGLVIATPRIVFRDCHFRKKKANYFASAVNITMADTVEFLGCAFYDTRTAEDPETETIWDRTPYTAFCSSLGAEHYIHINDAETELFGTGGSTIDTTIVSRPFVYLNQVRNARFVNCEFKHYDTAIKYIGAGIDPILTLDGNLFYQLGAYLTSTDTAVARSYVVMVYGNAVITNNVFLGMMVRQPGFATLRKIVPFRGTGTGHKGIFVYNSVEVAPQVIGIVSPIFINYRYVPIREFRVWKTERDRGIMAFPDIEPEAQIIGGIDPGEEDIFEPAIQQDIAGDDLPALPWCQPR